MRNPALYALNIAVSALLAGCGGSQPPIGTPGAISESQTIARAHVITQRIQTASSFHLLYRFRERGDGGNEPDASMINVNGTLYGTTWLGSGFGLGAIFSLTSSGYERVLHAFSGGADGENPVALIAVKGAIYGVDYNYGKYDGGVLFKLSSSDYLTVLHSFGSSGDGGGAESLIDVHGKLYGTTTYGGGAPCGSFGCGTVFRATTSGAEKVLHSFAGGSDGAYPYGSLTNVNGTLYGTTSSGGSSNQGTVFAVTTSGGEQVLYSFKGGSDGAAPRAGLVNVRGTLYGTTSAGGGSGCGGGGCGTVYSIGANGYEKLLYSFIGGADGAVPMAPLIAVDGTLYGTTFEGGGSGCGGNGCGSIYSIGTTGTEKVLQSLGVGNRGRNPDGGLLNIGGTLYGTTSRGGGKKSRGFGTVFSVST